MQPRPQRQLFSRLAALAVLAFANLPTSLAGPDDELRAARLLENARPAQPGSDQSGQNAATADLGKIYAELVAKYPKHAEIRNAHAAYLWSIEEHGQAAVEWEIAAALDPTNADVAFRLGGCRLADGRIKEADELFSRAVALDPKNALYHYHMATALFLFRHQLGGTDAAGVITRSLSHFQRAVELDPFNHRYASGYAETFYGLPEPNWNEALRAWTHVMKISPETDFAYVHLARVSLRLGQKAEARDYLARVQGSGFERVKASLRRQLDEVK